MAKGLGKPILSESIYCLNTVDYESISTSSKMLKNIPLHDTFYHARTKKLPILLQKNTIGLKYRNGTDQMNRYREKLING